MKNITIAVIAACIVYVSCDKTEQISNEVLPLAPQELKANAISDVQVDLEWIDKSTNETGFKVQRKLQSGNFIDIGTVNKDVTLFSDKNLTPLTTYIYRVYSFNNIGNSITYSNEVTVSTKKTIFKPTVNLDPYVGFRATIAFGKYTLTNDGGENTTESGICWNTSPTPTINNNKMIGNLLSGTCLFQVSNLTPGTIYYVRAYATNSSGTGYSNEVSIKTKIYFKNGNGLTDNMGNTYKTVIIGNQEWMAENLRNILYADGSKVSNGTITDFNKGIEGLWTNYENNSANSNIYGKLYNWLAVTDKRNLCPTGWHVPSRTEFETLIGYLDGSDAGGRMKETGSTYWLSPNTNATNEGGFSARGAGIRKTYADEKLKQESYFWTNSPTANGLGWIVTLYSDKDLVFVTGSEKVFGLSVRCVKD